MPARRPRKMHKLQQHGCDSAPGNDRGGVGFAKTEIICPSTYLRTQTKRTNRQTRQSKRKKHARADTSKHAHTHTQIVFLSAGLRVRKRPAGTWPARPPICLFSGRLWGTPDCGAELHGGSRVSELSPLPRILNKRTTPASSPRPYG